MTIEETARPITRGVETDADTHVAAAPHPLCGGSACGSSRPRRWVRRLAGLAERVRAGDLVGVEGTGSDGWGWPGTWPRPDAGRGGGPRRPPGLPPPGQVRSAGRGQRARRRSPGGRQGRRRAGTAGRGDPAPMVAKRSARNQLTQAINQALVLVVTGPDDLRTVRQAHRGGAGGGDRGVRPGPGDAPDTPPDRAAGARPAGRVPRRPARRLDDLIAPPAPSAPPACSASTASARTPRRCRWSRPGTTLSGCARRPPGAPVRGRSDPRSGSVRLPPAQPRREPRPTTPCGGS